MTDLARLPAEQRIVVAQLSGTADRHAAGRGEGDPVAALREVSDDPVLLGLAAAAKLVDTEQQPRNQHAPRALQALREAGADERVMAEEAERVRERTSHPPHGV